MLSRVRYLALAVAFLGIAACSDDDDDDNGGGTGPTTGSLTVTISGLPAGTNGNVTVAGPSGFSQNFTAASTTVSNAVAGTYTATAANVTAGGTTYTAPAASATVTAGGSATLAVAYSAQTAPPPAQRVAVVSGSIISSRTFRKDTTYILRGFVYVQNGAELNIEAGTRIVGDSAVLGSALFILRGARINAIGTAAEPIVFTSQRTAGGRAPGDWGGLIIVGNARVNREGPIIIEGSNASVLGANPAGVIYGQGTNDLDNSGTLRYVRVEWAGFATLPDAELNSFTFGAVGSGTTLEYLQALAGLDDHYEWFGGTVDGRYLVSYESGDDHFDGAEGYRGRNQFLIGMQSVILTPRPGTGSPSVDPQLFEIDGCNGTGCVAPPGGANAQSAGRDNGTWNMNVFANFTAVHTPASVTVPSGGGVGMVLRRGTGGHYYNGVLARIPRTAISLRDTTSENRFLVDSLILRNIYVAQAGTVSGSAWDVISATNRADLAAFNARGSNIEVGAATVTAASLFTALPDVPANVAALDWTPPATSPIATGGLSSFAATPLIAARAGTFIQPTTYRGAAAPGGTKWWQGWTTYARN
jgi:hypothetical protein